MGPKPGAGCATACGPAAETIHSGGALLHIGELAALRRDALDLDAPTVSVVATAGHVGGHGWVVGPPKSAAGRRVVTIPAAIVPDVRAHLDTVAEPGPSGRVFRGPRGGGLRSSTFMEREFRPAVQRLGLAGLHFHDLRHTGNTLVRRPAPRWPT